jgi:hypothetical protein
LTRLAAPITPIFGAGFLSNFPFAAVSDCEADLIFPG